MIRITIIFTFSIMATITIITITIITIILTITNITITTIDLFSIYKENKLGEGRGVHGGRSCVHVVVAVMPGSCVVAWV